MGDKRRGGEKKAREWMVCCGSCEKRGQKRGQGTDRVLGILREELGVLWGVTRGRCEDGRHWSVGGE